MMERERETTSCSPPLAWQWVRAKHHAYQVIRPPLHHQFGEYHHLLVFDKVVKQATNFGHSMVEYLLFNLKLVSVCHAAKLGGHVGEATAQHKTQESALAYILERLLSSSASSFFSSLPSGNSGFCLSLRRSQPRLFEISDSDRYRLADDPARNGGARADGGGHGF